MPCLLFNSKKEFWNPVTRTFQKKPCKICNTIKDMEYPLAIKADDTVDCIYYGDNGLTSALEFIEKVNIDENFIREINKDILESCM